MIYLESHDALHFGEQHLLIDPPGCSERAGVLVDSDQQFPVVRLNDSPLLDPIEEKLPIQFVVSGIRFGDYPSDRRVGRNEARDYGEIVVLAAPVPVFVAGNVVESDSQICSGRRLVERRSNASGLPEFGNRHLPPRGRGQEQEGEESAHVVGSHEKAAHAHEKGPRRWGACSPNAARGRVFRLIPFAPQRSVLYRAAALLSILWGAAVSPAFATVTQDENGWTDPSLVGGHSAYYVSSSTGDDANDGTSPEEAVETVAEGLSKIEAGDHLLFKRGDTFTDEVIGALLNGVDADTRTVYGVYGSTSDPLPLFETGTLSLVNDTNGVSHVIIQGLEAYPHTRLGTGETVPNGINVTGTVNNLLIEGCKIREYIKNISVDGDGASLEIRRNVILDAYDTNPSVFTTGIVCGGFDYILIEENFCDHNGWGHGGTPSQFNHDIYIGQSTSGTTIVRDNIASQAPSSAIKIIQPFGTLIVTGNGFLRNGYDGEFGHYGGVGDHPANTTDGLDLFTFEDNYSLEATGEAGVNGGTGWLFRRIEAGTIKRNLRAHRLETEVSAEGFRFESPVTVTWSDTRCENLAVEDNVQYDCLQNWRVDGNGNTGLAFANNIIQEPNLTTSFDPAYLMSVEDLAAAALTGGIYTRGGTSAIWFSIEGGNATFAEWVAAAEATATSAVHSFFDPSRNLDSYAVSIGLADADELFDALRAQKYDDGPLNPDLTAEAIGDYARVGFNLDPLAESGGDLPAGYTSVLYRSPK